MDEIKRGYWLLVWMNVALFAVTMTIGVFAFISNRHRSNEGKQAHSALCVFKKDLRVRVRDSVEFLADHPKGIPGIPVGTLITSVHNQQLTLKSLDGLECSK